MSQSTLSEFDRYLLAEGTYDRAYEKLGAHLSERNGQRGVQFAVWAPNAESVSVIGDFNNWNPSTDTMRPSSAGVWEDFVPDIGSGFVYKYHVESRNRRYVVDKADPFGFAAEIRPRTASCVWDLQDYSWLDGSWMANRAKNNSLNSPISIYEAHLGSWMRVPEEAHRWLTYREMAPLLADYVHDAGFTHVEFLPVMEHPFDGSWGYQIIGYFAPTSRFGTPSDFMFLIDYLHQRGIGVILDWVPAHFPKDEAGLGYFDGTHLYEHADPKQAEQPDWNTFVFNYGRNEVQSFLISNAMFWFDKYHVDGLRVDAVASMLYLDYGRREGQWIPNRYGGKENLEAIHFMREVNKRVYESFPDVIMIAEESTAWPQVSRPIYLGGLGFGLKWNMGWMHDMLDYMSQDPILRSYHHSQITFSLVYAFAENFILPFSHDEVVYGKGSMLRKMPGDDWQKFANLRLLYGFMFGHPGKKLLFMGDEFGQWSEWNHEASLEWHLLKNPFHAGLLRWVRDLNTLYRGQSSLYESDFNAAGFEWVDCKDSQRSIISFLRRGLTEDDQILFVCNFTPVVRENYRVGVPLEGFWKEILNSDAPLYGGSGQGNFGGLSAIPLPIHGRPYTLNMTLPPLGIVAFQPESQYGR
ncbi:MAG TPA: 1,4-alpha-glucan branching protein GlgB [Candidatus Saccharimonadales bacterium]|jgi:1,4-alpha-glucan branching enzyme|nr:1,4-alpha-glucan branching protein GlgB [Candidatus Saccharimonadales bacterium]